MTQIIVTRLDDGRINIQPVDEPLYPLPKFGALYDFDPQFYPDGFDASLGKECRLQLIPNAAATQDSGHSPSDGN